MSFPLIPDLIVPSVTDLNPELLKEHGIGMLMMDFDNTIVPYTTNTPTEEMQRWLHSLKQWGIAYCVVSNSKRDRVVKFCKEYEIPCITHSKKPFPKGIRQALRTIEHDGGAALVGDQIYTDVLGANCCGVTSILVTPIHLHNWLLKLRHVAEKPFIFIGKRRMKHE